MRLFLSILIILTSCAWVWAQDIWFYSGVSLSSIDGTIGTIDISNCSFNEKYSVPRSADFNLLTAGYFTIGPNFEIYMTSAVNSSLLKFDTLTEELSVVIKLEHAPDIRVYHYTSLTFINEEEILLIANRHPEGLYTHLITYNVKTGELSDPIAISHLPDPIIGMNLIENRLIASGGTILYEIIDTNFVAISPSIFIAFGNGIAYRTSCDSTSYFFSGGIPEDIDGSNVPGVPPLCQYNIHTQSYERLCEDFPFNNTFQMAIRWEDHKNYGPCDIEIDLDRDNSTIPGIDSTVMENGDFRDTTRCELLSSRISDLDVFFNANVSIDSLVLLGDFEIFTFHVSMSYPLLINKANNRTVFIPKEDIPPDSLAYIMSQVEVTGNLNEPTTLSWNLLAYHDDVAYDTVTIELYVPVRQVYGGIDDTLSWCLGDAIISSDALSVNKNPGGQWVQNIDSLNDVISPGNYQLIYVVEDEYCGSDSAYTNLHILPPPDLIIEGDSTVCVDSLQWVYASGTNLTQYLWSNGRTEKDQLLGAGNYQITVSDDNGCEQVGEISIEEVFSQFSIVAVGDICNGLTLSLSGDPAEQLIWNTGETVDQIIIQSEGNYGVNIIDTYGCPYYEEIIVDRCPLDDIDLPNIFSPNGDGNNDVFSISSDIIEYAAMYVYDRWGNLIYHCNQGNDCSWDGNEVSVGVYTILLILDIDGIKKYKSLDLTLVR